MVDAMHGEGSMPAEGSMPINGGKIDYHLGILNATELFSNMPQDDLLQILEFSKEHKYRRGAEIFSADSPSGCMYIIIDGEVVVEKGSGRSRQQLARYTTNDFFGESGLFLPTVRGADARATRMSNLLCFPASLAIREEMLRAHPAFCNVVFNRLIAHVAYRIRSVNGLISKRKRWVNTLKEQLIVDKLTGLYNAKSYREEFVRQLIDGRPVIAVMVKPRNFKTINDSFGHEVGDAALHKMGSVFLATIATSGRVFRYISSEFAVVFHGVAMNEVHDLIESVISKASTLDLRRFGVKDDIHLSFASHVVRHPDEHMELPSLLDYAHAQFMKVFSREP